MRTKKNLEIDKMMLLMGFDIKMLNIEIELKKMDASQIARLSKVPLSTVKDFLIGRKYSESDPRNKDYRNLVNWFVSNSFDNCLININNR